MGSPESGTSAPPSAVDTGHYVLSLAALSKLGYVGASLKPVEPTKAMLGARLSQGDLLISRSNTQELVGLAGIFDEERDDVSFPDTMMRLRVDESRVSKCFLEAVLLSRRGRLHMMRSAAGTSASMKKINRRTLTTFVVPTPSLAVQQRLLTVLSSMRRAAQDADESAARIRALRTAFTESLSGA